MVVAKGLLNTKKSEEIIRGIHCLSREGSKIQGSGFVESEGVGTEFAVEYQRSIGKEGSKHQDGW